MALDGRWTSKPAFRAKLIAAESHEKTRIDC
jgi:hypothetical protein